MSDDPIVQELERLRRPAPARVLPSVLLGAGLADGYVRRQGPAGEVLVAFNRRGVSFVTPVAAADGFEHRFRERTGREVYPAAAMPPKLARSLDRVLATGRTGGLPVDLGSLSDFQRDVLLKTAEIPPGEVRPYGWVAGEIGRPRAVRAVGTALARNPVPVVVPCHRVVRTDGRIGNYAFGSEVKGALLAAEGVDLGELEALAERGVHFVASARTRIYCHPTCRDARRVTDRHRVEFGNAGEARAAGYRPCRHCRPAAA